MNGPQVVGPHATANTLIMRGVFSKLTIPIWYGYDTRMDPDTLIDVINKIQKNGYHVIGITTDSHTTNVSLAKKLGVTGYSLSEVLILTSSNLKYDHRLFIELRIQYKKTTIVG